MSTSSPARVQLLRHARPAAEVEFEDVRVPASNILLGEGRGFEIAQGRSGRAHPPLHAADRPGRAGAGDDVPARPAPGAFGVRSPSRPSPIERIAESRIAIDQARLLTLKTAHLMDTVGNKEARAEIAMIKVAAPNMACKVIDWAIQAFGGAGANNDYGLAAAYATARLFRLADGPTRCTATSWEARGQAARRRKVRSSRTTATCRSGHERRRPAP